MKAAVSFNREKYLPNMTNLIFSGPLIPYLNVGALFWFLTAYGISFISSNDVAFGVQYQNYGHEL